MSIQDARKELALLVDSHYPIIYLDTYEEGRATEVLGMVAQDLNIPFYVWSVTEGLARSGGAPMYNTQEAAQVLAQMDSMDGDGLFLLKDFHKFLGQDVIVRKLRDLCQAFRRSKRSIVISAPVDSVPVELEKDVARFTLGLPDPPELTQIAVATVQEIIASNRIRNELTQDGMPDLVRALSGLTRNEARRVLTQAVLENRSFDAGTIKLVRQAKSSLIKDQGVLEFLKDEQGLDSVGGLRNLKAWLDKRRGALTPEAARFGLDPPKGILILGVQGCGKSLCAKAVAHEWKMQLLKFDSSRLFEKYVGESEKNLRKSLHVAQAVAPCILWIDEIEKMFPQAALHSEADAGLSARVFGTFLTWMQEKTEPVFVVATSNDISALPPELLRKGRFDEIFFVDLPGLEERKTIFSIHLRKRKQDPTRFDLAQLGSAAEGFSGAEIEQAVVSALYSAFAQKSQLTTEMVRKEVESTYPLSVTMKEKVESLRAWAHERTVPAD